jgi:hypothetical protein
MASFFFDKKTLPTSLLPKGAGSDLKGNDDRCALSMARKIIRSKSRRRTEHLVAVDVNPVPMTRREFLFVGRDDCSAPGGKTQN